LIPKILSLVQDGSCYEIENVLVTHTEAKYKYSGHRFRLNLMDRTRFTKIDGGSIPQYHYDFVNFREVLDAPREDRHVGNKTNLHSNMHSFISEYFDVLVSNIVAGYIFRYYRSCC